MTWPITNEQAVFLAALQRCEKTDRDRRVVESDDDICCWHPASKGDADYVCHHIEYGSGRAYDSKIELHFDESGALVYAEGWGE